MAGEERIGEKQRVIKWIGGEPRGRIGKDRTGGKWCERDMIGEDGQEWMGG